MEIVPGALGLFTLNGAGNGPAVVTDANYQPVTHTAAARAGANPVAVGNRAGSHRRARKQPAPVAEPTTDFELHVGGKRAAVRYRGHAPGFAGLDHGAFGVPAGLQGCSISLATRTAGKVSDFTTIAVNPGRRTCSDPHGFTADDLNRIGPAGLRAGTIELSRSSMKMAIPDFGQFDSTTDSGNADFVRYTADALIRSQGMAGASCCAVYAFAGDENPADPIQPLMLDAGPFLTLTGPKGQKQLPRKQDGSYDADLGGGRNYPECRPALRATWIRAYTGLATAAPMSAHSDPRFPELDQ